MTKRKTGVCFLSYCKSFFASRDSGRKRITSRSAFQSGHPCGRKHTLCLFLLWNISKGNITEVHLDSYVYSSGFLFLSTPSSLSFVFLLLFCPTLALWKPRGNVRDPTLTQYWFSLGRGGGGRDDKTKNSWPFALLSQLEKYLSIAHTTRRCKHAVSFILKTTVRHWILFQDEIAAI